MTRLSIGEKGENIAVNFLKKLGYKIVVRNYTCAVGEVDIIAIEKKAVVFVEVKARTTDKFGAPKLAVNDRKQRQISKVALSYLKKYDLLDKVARFDVIDIVFTDDREEVELIRNAFDLTE